MMPAGSFSLGIVFLVNTTYWGKLATVCVAGEHDSELVLLVTSSVDRYIVLPLHCDGGPHEAQSGPS